MSPQITHCESSGEPEISLGQTERVIFVTTLRRVDGAGDFFTTPRTPAAASWVILVAQSEHYRQETASVLIEKERAADGVVFAPQLQCHSSIKYRMHLAIIAAQPNFQGRRKKHSYKIKICVGAHDNLKIA